MQFFEQGMLVTGLFLLLVAVVVTIWIVSVVADQAHIHERRQRKINNAEAIRKEDFAFYRSFIRDKNSAVQCYRAIYGVSTKCARQIVNEIEKMYLLAKQ